MSDYDALPALIDAMKAAGFHDLNGAQTALDRAEAALPTRFHQSRTAIERSREAATTGRWEDCWAAAIQATHTLTGPFPPDPAKCPPRPDDTTAFARDAACTCGAGLPAGSRFCAICGTPVA